MCDVMVRAAACDAMARPGGGRVVLDTHVAEFTSDDVLALAGAKSFERGIGYVQAVAELEMNGDIAYATVRGNDLYNVELHVGPAGLSGTCDCPWGEEGNFCKHCVAVALVYEYGRDHGESFPVRFNLRSGLELLDHDELVDLLVEAADLDGGLRRRLRDLIGG
jgi:uncharacterized Zn finger protein